MKQVIVTISLLLVTCCPLVSLANTNSISQPLPPTASDQPQTIDKDQPIDGHLYEFSYTLDFAREMGFRNIVELLEEENYPVALQALEEKTRAGFQWSTEATNGYQYGFFAEALKGICLEKMGEVVKAYRAYQNARYYCDEEKVSLLGKPFQAPKLEAYVGIGRMCNQAGRYTDAIAYLDNARMEAAEYPSVAIVADRGLIQRASGLGDLEEMLFLYEDLKSLGFMRIYDYGTYAETLFRKGLDRKGFKVLLNTMIEKGINNDLGRQDPLVKTFLDHFARTDKNEISLYYDILGSEIQYSRMKYGDEIYIAFLLNARFILCKLCDYLDEEDDIQKVKAKITIIKNENQNMVAENDNKFIKIIKKRRKENKKYIHDITQDIQVEDQLMQAEINFKKERFKAALAMYQSILSNVNDQAAQEYYDDTTLKQATEVGYYSCQYKLNRKICDIPIELNNYLIRDNILGLLLYTRATNDILEGKYEVNFIAPLAINFSHPIYMKKGLVRNIIKKWGQQGKLQQLTEFFNKTSTNDIYLLREIAYENGLALLCQAKFYESFQNDLLRAKYRISPCNNLLALGYGPQNEMIDILKYRRKKIMVKCMNANPSITHLNMFVKSGTIIKAYKDVLRYIESINYDNALISYEYFNSILYHGSSTEWMKALIYIKQGNYDNANDSLCRGLSDRDGRVRDFTNNKFSAKMTSKEIEIIKLYENHIKPENLEWISKYQ